ncbi:MAG TPA: hypothetical protein VJM33_13885 [Microthrixaceae bacterium]|nr:hypothetical protein [Microthrixaceae bacterium]
MTTSVPDFDPANLMGIIERVVAEGVRRPGDAAGERVAAMIYDRFVGLGLEFPVFRRREALKAEPAREGDPPPGSPAASGWAYDPDETFASSTHLLPFSMSMQHTMDPAIEAGAVGFVGVLHGYPGDCRYYVPYDGLPRSIPGVYVNASQIRPLDEATGRGATATIRVDATRGTTTTHNVIGELAGVDDDWVVIGTHHDAPWASAVEDGSGIALVLAQAEAWSQVPAEQRPHRLVFLAAGAHMVAGAGTSGFVEAHAADMDRIVLEVHLEHAAVDTAVDGTPLDRVTPRWWFTTEVPWLEQVVWDAIVTEGLDRSLMLTPDALDHRPTTDGGFFHEVGVPLVNYLAAPWYLFDPADTLDKVDVPTLGSLSRAAWRIVAATRGLSPADARGSSG